MTRSQTGTRRETRYQNNRQKRCVYLAPDPRHRSVKLSLYTFGDREFVTILDTYAYYTFEISRLK